MAMRRKKIRLRYKKERVVFSDVLPYELPLIFSNRYFYRFLVRNGVWIEMGAGDKDKLHWNKTDNKGFLGILGRSLKVPWNPILTKDSTYPIQEEWNISNAM